MGPFSWVALVCVLFVIADFLPYLLSGQSFLLERPGFEQEIARAESGEDLRRILQRRISSRLLTRKEADALEFSRVSRELASSDWQLIYRALPYGHSLIPRAYREGYGHIAF